MELDLLYEALAAEREARARGIERESNARRAVTDGHERGVAHGRLAVLRPLVALARFVAPGHAALDPGAES